MSVRKSALILLFLPLLGAFVSCGQDQGSSLNEQLGYAKSDVLVIVHVDDLGMHKDETDGSLAVLRYGMAKSGSVMVPAPDFERTAAIWKTDKELDLGVHLTLTSEWQGKAAEDYRWPQTSRIRPRE